MGVDVIVKEQKEFICPKCGERFYVPEMGLVACMSSGGRNWYDYLERIGYYVPFEKRTDNTPDWYGKDMGLEDRQARELAEWARRARVDNACEIESLIARALMRGDRVAINADW